MVIRRLLPMATLLAMTCSSAWAEVSAKVDRPTVDLNESFLLEISVDSVIDAEPDLSVLDENFYRGQVSHVTDTSIYNGQISRSRIWSVVLMAKATGSQQIPSITVGGEQSAPITIEVNEPAHAPPGEADVFVTSEVDQPETFVQAQILYRIKVYRAVATRQPSLREPTISGVEALVELAGDERQYESILGGRAYNVVERVIAIYPQQSGDIEISPAIFEARVLRNGRITGRKVFESKPHEIKILPVPPPPADFPDATWLPARDVVLSEQWSREPTEIKAGEPLTRHVTVSALGQIETQIPALLPPEVDGMNIYADKPELSRRIEADGIRGIRKDQYAMIGVRGGDLEIPELEVPWWDIEAGEWRVARLPALTLQIEAPIAPIDASTPVTPVDGATPDDGTRAADASDVFWKQASQLLAAIWVLTVLLWWWSARDRDRPTSVAAPPPVYKLQSKFVKAAKKSARSGDLAGTRQALLEWAKLEWPENAPRSIGELAQRVPAPIADELAQLSAVSYGRNGSDWDGKGLAKLVGSIRAVHPDDRQTNDDPLPPLLPAASTPAQDLDR